VGQAAVDAVLIGTEDAEFDGGSYVIVQKYLHDLAAWNALSTEAQERIIGRTKLSDIELDDAVKPSSAHSALTTIVENGKEIKILRDNMPFGHASQGDFGTYFIGYSRSPRTLEQMLENMFVGRPPGNYDRLLDFSRAVTGNLFFIPSATFLESVIADEPAHEPAPSVTPIGDGSLGSGALKGNTRLLTDRLTRPSSTNTRPSHSRTPRLGCVEEGLFWLVEWDNRRGAYNWGTAQAMPQRRVSFRLREIHDPLTGAGSRELPDGALHAIALPVGLHRIDRVVVRRARRETVHIHAKYRLRVFLIQPDVRFRRLVERIRTRAVVHDPVVLVRAAGIIARPPDSSRIVVGRFELRVPRDLHARGLCCRRLHLGFGNIRIHLSGA
jgi:hypothetical protein